MYPLHLGQSRDKPVGALWCFWRGRPDGGSAERAQVETVPDSRGCAAKPRLQRHIGLMSHTQVGYLTACLS